ncbi:MAG: hypothetical protein AAF696_10035 [Bacteroidota bacterium]
MPSRNINKIQELAAVLGDLLNNVVFVGGSVLELYVTDEAAYENRPTDDIDIIITAPSLGGFYSWEQQLDKKGFIKVPEEACGKKHAWKYENLFVNLLPMFTETLGYTNRWYEEAVFHASTYNLPNGTSIKLFPPAYYLAAKIEAYHQRGKDDIRMSEDFEDIIYLLGSRLEILEEIGNAFHEVRKFIREAFLELLQDYDLEEGICYALPDGTDVEAVERIVHIMREATQLQPVWT